MRREACGDAVVAPDDRMKHVRRVARCIARGHRMAIDQRDAPTVRCEPRGHGASRKPRADDNSVALGNIKRKRQFMAAHAPAWRESRDVALRVEVEVGRFQRALECWRDRRVQGRAVGGKARERFRDALRVVARRCIDFERVHTLDSISAQSPMASVSTARASSNSSRCRPATRIGQTRASSALPGRESSTESGATAMQCSRPQRDESARQHCKALRKAGSSNWVNSSVKTCRPCQRAGRSCEARKSVMP